MNRAELADLSERRMVAAGLRGWVDDLDQEVQPLTAAAVELLVRARGGEFADPGWPWVREGAELGRFWLDMDAMAGWDGGRPAGPVMSFVEALAGGRPARPLAGLLAQLDAATVRLVLCAFDHAAAGADRDVALYAFGGDPRHLVQRPAEPAPWPVDVLDELDRPTVQVDRTTTMRPRLRAAGAGR